MTARHKRAKQLATNRHYLSKRYCGMAPGARKQNEILTVQTNRSVRFSTWILGDALIATVVLFLKVKRFQPIIQTWELIMITEHFRILIASLCFLDEGGDLCIQFVQFQSFLKDLYFTWNFQDFDLLWFVMYVRMHDKDS